MHWKLPAIVLLVGGCSVAVQGIIPGRCVHDETHITESCCPQPPQGGGPCGSLSSPRRGRCMRVADRVDTSNTDSRNNWPNFFTHLCECEGNYYGYDCGECKFGYTGDDCSERVTRKRKSVTSLSDEERDRYLRALKQAKTDHTYNRFWAIKNEKKVIDYYPDTPPSFVKVPLYDLFTWIHHYVARENDKLGKEPAARDYAHESGGFLTWHRLYLLWFEREVQILTGQDDFTIPYWDWTEPKNREFLLTDEWLGGQAGNGYISGYFGDGSQWKTVCWERAENPSTDVCNPLGAGGGPLLRCRERCNKDSLAWPDHDEITKALGFVNYDSYPYTKESTNSFRNYLEGFEPDGCQFGSEPLCTSDKIRRRLHNSIHVILSSGGNGDIGNFNPQDGTMGYVQAAANDPIFLNHHCFIDYIFEKWLSMDEHENAEYKPDGTGDVNSHLLGHRKGDYIVPFIPLHNHEDMFKTADNFGYEYDSGIQPIAATVIIMVSAAAVSIIV